MSSMFPVVIERIDDKLDAFETALRAAVDPNRVIGLGFEPYTERSAEELTAGVWNIVSAGEGSYSRARNMAAREGTLKLLLIGHVQVEDDSSRSDLMLAEIELMEEIKRFVRAGVAGMTLVLDSIEQSRLLEHPYGWVVAYLELQPPNANTH